MKEPGREARHGDKNGEINREHGNTIVRTLRKIYGSGFTPGFNDSDKLSTVLQKLDKSSLSQLHGDHDVGLTRVKHCSPLMKLHSVRRGRV